jgi:hypothetical protein
LSGQITGTVLSARTDGGEPVEFDGVVHGTYIGEAPLMELCLLIRLTG